MITCTEYVIIFFGGNDALSHGGCSFVTFTGTGSYGKVTKDNQLLTYLLDYYSGISEKFEIVNDAFIIFRFSCFQNY